MSQFDVYINPSKNSRSVFPFIIDIQNVLLSDIKTRIVIPLGKLSHFNHERMHGLTPLVEYENEKFILLTPQITSIPSNLLKKPVGSLAHIRDEIIGSLDFAITGI
ncbi:MAG: toxin CcdB [Phenylobacterium sp.]|jgi:toxin CcdB